MAIKAVESKKLSKHGKIRYVLIDTETGEILDDANGYGYKSGQKAHACWGYKNRDKSKDAEKAKRNNEILNWMKQHKKFMNELDYFELDFAMHDDGEVDAAFLKHLLKSHELEIDFKPGEFLRVWKNKWR